MLLLLALEHWNDGTGSAAGVMGWGCWQAGSAHQEGHHKGGALGLLSVVRKGQRLREGEWPRDMVDVIASQSTLL